MTTVLRMLKRLVVAAGKAIIGEISQQSERELRILAARYYVLLVGHSRKIVTGLLGMLFSLFVVIGGFILFHVGAMLIVYEMTGSFLVVGIVAVAFGFMYIAIALLALTRYTSEIKWTRRFRIHSVVSSAVSHQARRRNHLY